MVPRKCHACYAMPCAVARIDAALGDHPTAHPLWCRESATPAMSRAMARTDAAFGDHPLRTPCGVEKVPRLLCPAPWPA
eukprot:5259859-Pyramimonas_sp.AAC.1